MTDHSRRTVLRGIAGASAAASAGVSVTGTGSIPVAARAADWSEPPGVAREFTFETGGPVPSEVTYLDADDPADARFALQGIADAGTDGEAVGGWYAEYDRDGELQRSVTMYDSGAGYDRWLAPFATVPVRDDPDTLFFGYTYDASSTPQAVYRRDRASAPRLDLGGEARHHG